ncbi:rhomboid family intramembrane serine protease [Corynebacterium sp.]|uniref:rhomboid family intramembrane serine protease n=1 Tax=Corynebacterium sp. TaxID=1720 RepID=UPI0034C6BA28
MWCPCWGPRPRSCGWITTRPRWVGASGALFALMALLLGVYRSRGLSLRAPIFFVLANVAYTFLASHVSLWGHLGGLCTGLILLPFLFARRKSVRWVGIAVVAVIAGVLLSLRAGLWG